LVAERFAVRDEWDESLGVGWTGTGPSPVWLDAAREYMERWMHQQHIRAALNEPGVLERHWYHPVLETAVRALPRTYEPLRMPAGTSVRVVVDGAAGGAWRLERRARRWRLAASGEDPGGADAEVILVGATAWRVFARAAGAAEAAAAATQRGDPALTSPVLRSAAVMTTTR
jgi:hypothetical protein